jgi:hypothetical protein
MMNEVSPIKITRFLKKFKILRPTILLFQIFHSGFRQDQFIRSQDVIQVHAFMQERTRGLNNKEVNNKECSSGLTPHLLSASCKSFVFGDMNSRFYRHYVALQMTLHLVI